MQKKTRKRKEIYIEADGQHSHSPGIKARKVSGTCRCTTWRRFRMAWLYDATFTAAQGYLQSMCTNIDSASTDRHTDGNLRRVQCCLRTTRSLRHANKCNCPLEGKARATHQNAPFLRLWGNENAGWFSKTKERRSDVYRRKQSKTDEVVWKYMKGKREMTM